MSAIKSFVYDLLTDGNHLSNIEMNQVSEIMKHSTEHVTQLEFPARLSLDSFRISITERDTDHRISIRPSILTDATIMINNAVEEYLKSLDYDRHQLFIKSLHTELSNQISANEMSPPADVCKLKAVD